MGKRGTRGLHLGNANIKRGQPGIGHRTYTRLVIYRIQPEQLADLIKGKSGPLRGPDETQPTKLRIAIATDTARPSRPFTAPGNVEQPPPLVESNGLHTDATCAS